MLRTIKNFLTGNGQCRISDGSFAWLDHRTDEITTCIFVSTKKVWFKVHQLQPRKAVFLDRDGVINYDPGDYTYRVEDFHIIDGVDKALQLLHQMGYLLIVITNQGGIAKGLYTAEDVNLVHDHLYKKCIDFGAPLTDIFYSPHHDTIGRSISRKPGSLMIERAIARHGIDPSRSVMVGDKPSDVEAAAKCGIRGVQIPRNASLLDYVDSLASH